MVVIHVPPTKYYTSRASRADFEPIRAPIESVHKMALRGDIWKALSMNGLLYSAVLGHDPMIAIEAMSKGALAAGLTGTGSATVAIARPDEAIAITNAWRSWHGRVIITRPAVEGARMEEADG